MDPLAARVAFRFLAGLEVYLNDPGKVPGIGAERGKKPTGNAIAKYVSPHGSTRYVAYVEGEPVSALQVVSKDKKTAIIANVFTTPEARRQGWASRLLATARHDFKIVQHASEEDISEEGKKWRNVVKEAFKYVPKETKEHKVERVRDVIREQTGLSKNQSHDIADAYVRGREIARLALQKNWPIENGVITGPKGTLALSALPAL
jgi:predicted GNAT family acetyltransferase